MSSLFTYNASLNSFHSVLRLSTGFILAARMAWKPMVSMVIIKAAAAESINTSAVMVVR